MDMDLSCSFFCHYGFTIRIIVYFDISFFFLVNLEQLSDSKHAVYSPRFNNTMDKLVRLSWFHNTL